MSYFGVPILSVASVALSVFLQTGDASADQFLDHFVQVEQSNIITDHGAANRVVAADLLRTLSQEIPAAVCYLSHDVDVEEASDLLNASVAHFDLAIVALRDGNENLGIIGAERLPRVVREINELVHVWEPIHEAAISVLNDPRDLDAAMLVYASADPMLDATYHLLVEIEAEYSNPVELLQSDMLNLEVSGRMAMFTQRIAYESCRTWAGEGNEEMVADLRKTIGHFEASMAGLTNGLPELGLRPAPTPEIAASLDDIAQVWSDIRRILDAVSAGETTNI
ncbi:hypothetical protein DS901_09885 [Loktanella sp. D2R18]|uniref:type IV pili methyl-accepting chemotaxis transducer N-terminal domain-containing protein n=1 Tax=Rhodobacterales TaxID=204455 RepID=UPI000DE9B280|nr:MULTISPECIES: type IV pili methyl-accepting chemotaxis transducer N-terminal domain-containing protein [Rhodobacterales]MDO6591425.1 type IV pili methyl-accepting chemotaxis transducer N-terminal domain-containing protein [Yoonia sp. 1_MG-2023]RBW43508.1 hypothetical protein DS901_09885 [Loktanella sp. D2R18]